MALMKVFATLAMLCAAEAANCNNGNCLMDDETSLVQVQKELIPGSERVAESGPAQIGDFPTFTDHDALEMLNRPDQEALELLNEGTEDDQIPLVVPPMIVPPLVPPPVIVPVFPPVVPIAPPIVPIVAPVVPVIPPIVPVGPVVVPPPILPVGPMVVPPPIVPFGPMVVPPPIVPFGPVPFGPPIVPIVAEAKASSEEKFDENTEAFTLEEAVPTSAPSGCTDMGCIGSGPNCGGNSFDCINNGWVVSGWYKTCSSGGDTCGSGWKVRCAKCPAGGTPVPMPAPAAAAGPWTAPAFAPAPALVAPTPFPPLVMPNNTPSYLPGPFDPTAVMTGQDGLAIASVNLTLSKQALADATKLASQVRANITLNEQQEASARQSFQTNRAAAVNFAKKRELANITIMRAQKAMSNAFFAQEGAAQGAQNALVAQQNADTAVRYYQKDLVDRTQAVKDSQAALSVGQLAVKKALSDLALAKQAAQRYQALTNSAQKRQQALGAQSQKLAMNVALKSSLQSAYIEASQGRNDTNVPPYGGVSPQNAVIR